MGFPLLVRCHLYIESGPCMKLLYDLLVFMTSISVPGNNHDLFIFLSGLPHWCMPGDNWWHWMYDWWPWLVVVCDCVMSSQVKDASDMLAAALEQMDGLLAGQRIHDDVIKWKHFPCYWPFVRGIHLSPVNSPRKGQWRGALMFSLICVWINDWVNNHEVGDLRHYPARYDVIVMYWKNVPQCSLSMQLSIFSKTFSIDKC